MRPCSLAVGILLLAVAVQASLVAVVDHSHARSAQLDADQLRLLCQEVRGAASAQARPEDRILSEENTFAILTDMGVDPSQCDGDCDIQLARQLQADWLVSWRVVRFGDSWSLQANLFETGPGRLVSSRSCVTAKAETLPSTTRNLACMLLAEAWRTGLACPDPEPETQAIAAPPATRSAQTPVSRQAKPESTVLSGSSGPARATSGSVQCRGITQAGRRCLHRTRSPSGYCPQHENQATGATGFKDTPMPAEDAGRCKAITQKGTRCTRRAKANGYCWQHQPNR